MRTGRPERRRRRRGFSLMEILIALVVIVFGLYAILDLLAANRRHSALAHKRILATELARGKMAEIQAIGYEPFTPFLPRAADAPTSPTFFPPKLLPFAPPYDAKPFMWQARFDRIEGQPDTVNVEVRVMWYPTTEAPPDVIAERSVTVGGLLVKKEAGQ